MAAMDVQTWLDSASAIFSSWACRDGEMLQVKWGEPLIYVAHRGVLSSCRIQRVPSSVV